MGLDPLGALEIQGLSEPVTAFRLTGARPLAHGERGRLRARSAFVGREREAATLQSLVADLARGQGHVAGIVGEPGVGKSRLLGELRHTIGDDADWFEGRCLSYGATIPYLPVLDLLRGVCGITDADTPEQAADRVHTRLGGLGLDAASRAPALLQLLGLKPAQAQVAALDGDALLSRTLDTLRQLWLRTSARRPLVLVVEDLHWIDPASERCLAGLAASLGGAAVLLLATYRPGYRPAWIDRSYAAQISLAPLGHDDSRRMVRSLAGSLADDPALTQLILDKAEGNPFFLEELVHAVGDEPGRPFAVPDSVQGVLAARIDRLPERAKLLLQSAAVLGREFSESLLRAIADAPDRVDADLRELTRLEFLHERADADEPAYVFKHALTQDVAYATLVAPRRRALHRRAAEALGALDADRKDELAPMLAHHYLEAEAWAEATVHARRAAEIASRAWANREALTRYDQALLAAERARRPATERRALLEARAAVCTVLGRFDPAREDLEAALALADDAAARGRVLSALGELWGGHRDYTRGLDLTRQAVSILGTTDDRRALAGARAQLGIMLLNIVRMRESRDELEAAHALYESLADERGQARALEILGMNLTLSGELERAATLLDRVIPMLRALGDRRAEAGALCSQGAVLTMQKGLTVGLRSMELALEVSRSMEARGDEAFAHALSAEMRAWFGVLDAAAAEAGQTLAIARDLGHVEWTAYGLGILGRVHAECGDIVGARALHDEEAVLTRQLGGKIWIADAVGNIGQDLVCAGELDEGRRQLTEAVAIAGECREKAMFPLLQLAACELRADRPDETLALVARYRGEFRPYRALLVEARRLEAEAWRLRGRAREAEAALQVVIADAEAFQYDACRWRAALALAEILRARGELDEARRHAAGVLADLERVARGLPREPLGGAFRQSALFCEAVRLAGSALTT
jgi:tetratricopeptide (TPR) repeat protein